MRRLPRKRALPVRLGERRLPLREPISLRLPRWFSAGVGHERIRMIVKIDGEEAARWTVRLPRKGSIARTQSGHISQVKRNHGQSSPSPTNTRGVAELRYSIGMGGDSVSSP